MLVVHTYTGAAMLSVNIIQYSVLYSIQCQIGKKFHNCKVPHPLASLMNQSPQLSPAQRVSSTAVGALDTSPSGWMLSCSFNRSLTNMWPGAWVITRGGAAWGGGGEGHRKGCFTVPYANSRTKKKKEGVHLCGESHNTK